jgi:hypothetical protein
MKVTNIKDRFTFLAEMFDVFECDNKDENLIEDKMKSLVEDGYYPSLITSDSNVVLGILSEKMNDKQRFSRNSSIKRTFCRAQSKSQINVSQHRNI